MIGCSVLDDFQGPDTGALVARAADEAPAIARRREQDGAGSREIGPRIEIGGYPDRMPEHIGVGIGVGIDIDAAHELHDLAGFGLIVGTGLVEVFADEIEQFSNFRVFYLRKSYNFSPATSRYSNFRVFQIRES